MVQPQMPGNTEAEEQVLACILSSPPMIGRVIDTLKSEHFVLDTNANIYDCMVALTRDRKAPTTFNVADELVRRQMRSYDIKQVRWELEQLAMSFALSSRLEDYAEVIKRASRSRRLIGVLRTGAEAAYRQEEGAAEQMMAAISAIMQDGDLRGFSTFADVVDRYAEELRQRRQDAKDGKTIGIGTGFKHVDRMIGGLRPGTLNILGARTSIGKTSFALAVALHAAKEAIKTGKDVALFSLEMLEGELVQRVLSQDTHIDQSLMRDGQINDNEFDEIMTRARELRGIGLHIADGIYLLDTIRASARVLCARRKIGLIIVDYLQLVDVPPSERGKQAPRHELVAEVSRNLKRLAQELDVPVLALAQLNREAEKSETPQLWHIGESDGIARDADLVAFLHVDTEEMKKRNDAQDYFIDFIARKARNGRLGQVRLWFRPRETRFEDVEAYNHE